MEKGSNLQPNGPKPHRRPGLFDSNASAAEITVAVCRAAASLLLSQQKPPLPRTETQIMQPVILSGVIELPPLQQNLHWAPGQGEGVLGEWTHYWFSAAAHVRALFSSTELKQGL